MKNKMLKIVAKVILVMTMIIGMINIPTIHAASISVVANKGSVHVGDTVTFTVSADGAGYVNVSGAVSDYIWLDNSSKSYTVTATSEGKIYVGATGVVADYGDGKDYDVADSCTISAITRPTVKPQEKPQIQDDATESEDSSEIEENDNRNKDSALKTLSVSVGTLKPNFDPEVTSYTVNVDGNTKSINVQATARDAKASVDGVGAHNLKVGNNTIYISGIAENGAVTTYKIKVHVDEKPLLFLTYNGNKMGVSRVPLEMESKLFERKTIKIDGKDVKVLKNDALHMTLVTLEKDGKKDFYIYDEETHKVVSIYRPMALCGENIAIIDVPKELQKRDGMKFTKVKVDKVELDGWTFDDPAFKNYVLIYVMNDAGKKVYYQYEKTENTLQLYNEGAPITQKKYEKSIHKYEDEVNDLKMIVYGLIGISVILGIGLIIVSVKKKKTKKFQKIDTMSKDLSKSSKIEKSVFMAEDNEGENL